MDTKAPQVPVPKKAPTRRAVSETINVDDNDDEIDGDEDFELESTAAAKKGGKKPAVSTKAASKAPAAAATKRRGAANKEPQVLGQKLLTDMLKPAENSGISPEKKVRKMRASPFNKKSSSVLGRAVNIDDDDEATTASQENSPSTSESVDDVVEVPASKPRPRRANRRQARYVLSDSESEKDSDDSEFDETED